MTDLTKRRRANMPIELTDEGREVFAPMWHDPGIHRSVIAAHFGIDVHTVDRLGASLDLPAALDNAVFDGDYPPARNVGQRVLIKTRPHVKRF